MARKRRTRRPGSRDLQATGEAPNWRWRTLPVWLALTGGFIIGWYVAAIGAPIFPTGWPYIVLVGVLVGFSFGLSRVSTYWFMRWRLRRARERAAGAPPRPRKEPRTPA